MQNANALVQSLLPTSSHPPSLSPRLPTPSSRSPKLLRPFLHHLPPQHILHNPQILPLPTHNLLYIREIPAQLLDFAGVELRRVRRGFFDVEACADVD